MSSNPFEPIYDGKGTSNAIHRIIYALERIAEALEYRNLQDQQSATLGRAVMRTMEKLTPEAIQRQEEGAKVPEGTQEAPTAPRSVLPDWLAKDISDSGAQR